VLNKIKIIGGKWRGRSIDFPAANGVRPTPGRVRETLFNWLAPSVIDAVFLDAFGGSGALSFEALSRGAKEGVFIENVNVTRKYCHENAEKLGATTLRIIQGTSPERFLSLKPEKPYDIVFLDPPFAKRLLLPSLDALCANALIDQQTLVYFEVEKTLAIDTLVANRFSVLKKLIAGEVCYGILALKAE